MRLTAAAVGTILLALSGTSAAAQENLLPDFIEEVPPPEAPEPDPEPAEPEEPGARPADLVPGSRDAARGDGADEDPVADPEVPTDVMRGSRNRDDLATRAATDDVGFVGPLTPRLGGYGEDLFAGSNGALYAAFMRRIDTPIASRWAHIVLRRALLTAQPTPANIRDGDWVAARTDLLTRMGEADGAQMLVVNLPLDQFTPSLYQAAARAHLAAADIPALCPKVSTARALSAAAFWELAAALCSGIEGDETSAVTIFNRLRREEAVEAVDLLLAERVTGLAGGVNRGANIDWEDASRLTALRFGLAAAGGAEIPDDLWISAPPAVAGWALRVPEIELSRKAEMVTRAAAAGIASSREIAALASLRSDRLPAGEDTPRDIERLRIAFTGRTADERYRAIEAIVEAAASEGQRFAGLLAAAPAAALIPPSSADLEKAPLLVEALLASGRLDAARAWWPAVSAGPEEQQLALWPLFALADDENRVPVSQGLFRGAFRQLAEGDGGEALARQRVKWLAAGLSGLGRIEGGQWDSVFEDFAVVRKADRYVEALSRVAARGKKGEVAVLAALGLQGDWSGVTTADVIPVLSALRQAGFAEEARLVAIEAMLRGS
jgi:hypothetical protein